MMVRRSSNTRCEKLRNLRCESADSGVDTSLFRQVNSSHSNVNGLEEDLLDFEPENGNDEFTDKSGSERNSGVLINSDQSTVKIVDSDGRNTDRSPGNCSTTTEYIGHRREMLPVPQIDAADGRQHEYFPYAYSTSASTRTVLDSSSDDSSSDSDTHDNSIETESDLCQSQNFNNSCDFSNDEQGSDYDLSQEEEDKLLGNSDEESSPTFSPIISGTVDVCTIGNSRITLPKFITGNIPKVRSNVSKGKCGSNDLKRTTPLACQTVKQKKRKKWDLYFKPTISHAHVFLQDIGFISNDTDCDSVSTNRTPTLPKLFVICNDSDKIVCEKRSHEFTRESAKSGDGDFKLPLPPPKRPPTRPKRTVCNSNESFKNLQIHVDNVPAGIRRRSLSGSSNSTMSYTGETVADKDDTISIIASTIGDNHEDPIGGSLASRTPSSHLETSPSRPDVRDISRSNELVENWIRSVPSSHQPPDDIAVMADAQPETEPAPHEGITFLPPLMQKGYPRIYFKDVPPIFLGLCYYYYFTGNCARIGNCDLYHNVPKEKYTAKFSKSTPDILRKGYSLALTYDHLFKEIYPCFLAAFGLLNMHNELMKSIKDLLGLAHIDATEAVDSVVQSFVQSGLPFLDVIERISFNVGFLQHPQLADILLDLITRKQNVSENWEVIQRIAKARGRISPDIARRILNRVTASYPVNKNLCLEIYNVIIKKNMTDVARISADVLAPFRAIEGFRDLEEVPSPICPGTVSPSRIPLVPLAAGFSDKEMMVAHIDRNLTRERERFEREVAGNTVTTKAAAVPVPAASPERSYFVQTYDYNHLTKLAGHYDGCFGSETDADDRYFMPSSRQEPFAVHKSSPFRSSDSDKHSAGGSCSSYNGITSPKSSLHFEPPELSEYVPDTVPCVDKRNSPRMVSPRNSSPSISPTTETWQSKSPSSRETENLTLTPPIPVFGSTRYRSDFRFDQSLHNLLPDSLEHVNINEKDVARLNYAIRSKNGAEFLRLLECYKAAATVRNFITMTIAHLKSCEHWPYRLFMDLVQALEMAKPSYAQDVHIKAILEVVVMNFLFELERRGQWVNARKLLELFCDWDSLISSQIFPKRRMTHMGRYIYLARVFAKGKNFHYTSEILQCPNLHLLEACKNWPYSHDPEVDLMSRNAVLAEFFKEGYNYNIADVSDMFRRVYKYNGIHGYDPYPHFNPMLISIINDRQVSSLKPFFSDIDIYNKMMDKNVLRALTVLLADQLSQENLFKLYDVCCDRQIYTYYNGLETNIILRTNMLDQELKLILSYYLEKIVKNGRVPNDNVLVIIKLFEVKPLYPKILYKCVRSIQDINKRVREILVNDFDIYVEEYPEQPTVVEIHSYLLQDWLQRSKKC